MQNAGLGESETRIKIAGRNIENLRYADDTSLMAESIEELKNFLMKVTEEIEKLTWNSSFEKTKFMASSPITSWQIDRDKMEKWQILFSWVLKSLQMVMQASN